MICMENKYGRIRISQNYFAALAGRAAATCFGVVGMCSSASQGLRRAICGRELPDKGVHVRGSEDGLYIDLHIKVIYGVNLTAITKSIVHKVHYVVEKNTGFKVAKVSVYIGEIVTGPRAASFEPAGRMEE